MIHIFNGGSQWLMCPRFWGRPQKRSTNVAPEILDFRE